MPRLAAQAQLTALPLPRLASHALSSVDSATSLDGAAATPSRAADLGNLRVADLRALATSAGLPTSGLKADLVARLMGAGERGVASSASASAPRRARVPPPSPYSGDPAAAATGLAVTWLGTSSGAPTPGRNVSSIALRTAGAAALVDAGEGTAVQLAAAAIPLAQLGSILITHLHGDHCFGLHSVLKAAAEARAAAAAAAGRDAATARLLVAGPPGLHALILAGLSLTGAPLPVPLLAVEFATDPAAASRPARAHGAPGAVALATLGPDATAAGKAAAAGAAVAAAAAASGGGRHTRVDHPPGLTWTLPLAPGLTAVAAQLTHRVPCWGYALSVVEGSGGGGAAPLAAGDASASPAAPSTLPRKVVLLGDTCGSASMLDPGRGCDLLSHEATFAAPMAAKAAIAQHSTAAMAGAFARELGAGRLVLTHFSGRYDAGPLAPAGARESDDADAAPVRGGLEADVPSRAIEALLDEARRAFRRGDAGAVVAARDLMTVAVPRRVAAQRSGVEGDGVAAA